MSFQVILLTVHLLIFDCYGLVAGIAGNILNAYYFLCLNYNFRDRKDEIVLVGFSHGAYTVRCLASFISCVGLIRRKTLAFLPELFKGWKDELSSQKKWNSS